MTPKRRILSLVFTVLCLKKSLLCKTLCNGIEFRQDLYLSIRKLSVDLCFRRRGLINITGSVFGNLRFHHIKTVLC